VKTTADRRGIVRLLLGVGVVGLCLHLAWGLGLGRGELGWLFRDYVYNLVMLAAAGAMLARALTDERERLAWILLASGVALSAAGDIFWTLQPQNNANVPYPSAADALYLACYPCLYVGIGLLVRARVDLAPSAWIDGAIAGLAAAAVATAALGPALAGLMRGDAAAAIVSVAYPLADILMVAFIATGAVVTGAGRTDRRFLFLGLGMVAWVAADGIFLYQEATTAYVGGLIDDLWLIGALLAALAAAMPQPPPTRRREDATVLIPAASSLAAVAVLAWDHFNRLPGAAIWISVTTLAVVVLRLWLSSRENTLLLEKVRTESVTDALTGLPNRRALLADLGEELLEPSAEPALLVIFDLDGFKAYNDSFGHPAGDKLLRRMGGSLARSIAGNGRAYRLGGDEFCVLARTDRSRFLHVLAASRAALTERGEGFSITSSSGAVILHEEVWDTTEAMRIADARMYEEKGRRESSADSQAREILMRILRERQPELTEHLAEVADLAADVGRRLDMGSEELDVVARAAELHDVGKVGIPDRVLEKEGPLDGDEWGLIHTHTLIGERILGAVPAMAPVSKVVRSSHERWDGGGYPDGLAGEAIPLAARIVAVCDAFDAMTTDRPYRDARSPKEALAELRRCAGTQFDPAIVELFAEVMTAALASPAGEGGQGNGKPDRPAPGQGVPTAG
jgi:diguanylate cyclase (GGDEF)-like protein